MALATAPRDQRLQHLLDIDAVVRAQPRNQPDFEPE